MSDDGSNKDEFRYDVRDSILEKLKNSEDMKRLHDKARAVNDAEKEYDKALDQEYVKALTRFRNGRDLDDMSYKLMKDLYRSSEILNSDNPVYKKRYEGYDDSPEYRKMYLDDLNKVSPKEVCDFIENMVPPGDRWRNDRQLKESVALVRYRDIDYKDFDPRKDPLYQANKKWSDAINDIQGTAAKVGEDAVKSILGAGLASEKASNFFGELYPGITYSNIETGELLERVNRILQKEDSYSNTLDYPKFE